MAQVDFSNAVLESNVGFAGNPLEQGYTFGLERDSYLYDGSSGLTQIGSFTRTVVADTGTRRTLLYVGAFTASGTEATFIFNEWRISNISFSAGDTFFSINIPR